MARRDGIIWADYSSNQTWATCPNWGTQNITLVLYPVTYAVATNCTIPPNVTPAVFAWELPRSRQQNNHHHCRVLHRSDVQDFLQRHSWSRHSEARLCGREREGGQPPVHVYPEWWGATAADATGAMNTPAMQAAIIGAYGDNRTNATYYSEIQSHLAFLYAVQDQCRIRVYHMIGFRWEGENQFGSGLRQQSCGLRIIDGQSIAYGRFENLRFENGCGGKSGAALVDIDYSRNPGYRTCPRRT